ncbi:uncharacterized protein LOC113359014 [Papaver somniferum]|uniref:uncharacterized protein LOC113359014 n=1 Tax=Papaver somniferum TaxID=3469 RepID=UPI000E6FCD1C|nr:uncharacterized protein LOC113359014 [Papaver somniferum]
MKNVVEKVVSKQQGAFIKGRGIHEKIFIASELVNELEIKRRGGNVGLKLDITQAYDSLNWNFLFETMRHFGFSETNDIFVFCNGHKNSLEHLMQLLVKYQQASGQVVNKNKSKCFVGGVTESRRREIDGFLQMELYDFPDKYLGVILQPGKVKKKAKWPSEVLKECERIIRNLLWSGDPAVKKLITVKWDEVCAPVEEGGLGIWRLEIVNKSLLLKLLRKIETEDAEWTRFMKEKYKNKKGEWITTYKKSSIWPGLKWVLNDFEEATRWIVGDGQVISVWKYKWVKTQALCDLHPQDNFIMQNKDMKVCELIINGKWQIPVEMKAYINEEDLPFLGNGADRRILETNLTGTSLLQMQYKF